MSLPPSVHGSIYRRCNYSVYGLVSRRCSREIPSRPRSAWPRRSTTVRRRRRVAWHTWRTPTTLRRRAQTRADVGARTACVGLFKNAVTATHHRPTPSSRDQINTASRVLLLLLVHIPTDVNIRQAWPDVSKIRNSDSGRTVIVFELNSFRRWL